MVRAIEIRLCVVMTTGLLYAVPLAAQDAYAPLSWTTDTSIAAQATADTVKDAPAGDATSNAAPTRGDSRNAGPTAADIQQARARLFVAPSSFRVPDTLESVAIIPEAADSDPEAAPRQDDEFCCDSRHLGLTMIEIGAVLVAPWYFNRNVSDDSTAVVGWDSWKRNILQGMEWDSDNFKTNMYGHPYGGNLYFNAARSNGYNFWQAGVFTWMGSFLWEMFGEANRPAINDWAATTIGGIALGETLNRTSRMVWNNSATGFERTMRELGGFILNPTGGASRLFRGEWTKIGKNPPDRKPPYSSGLLQAGARREGASSTNEAETGAYFGLQWLYGNPLEISADQKPFDSFLLHAELYGKEKTTLGRVSAQGTLWGKTLRQSEKSRQVFQFTQLFDYVNNNELETGGSSLSASFLSAWKLSNTWTLVARAEPSALLIWGTESEYANFTGRDYDFGAGLGARLWGGFRRNERDVLDVGYLVFWQHTLSGALGNHVLQFLTVRGRYPILGDIGLGATYVLTIEDGYYDDYPDVFSRFAEGRVYLTYFFRGPSR